MRALWVPGVNNRARFGRWHFAEFHHLFEIQRHFAELIDTLATEKAAWNKPSFCEQKK